MHKRLLKIGSINSKTKNLAISVVLPILLLLALNSLIQDYSLAQAQIAPQGKEKVGLGVIETLQSEGQARIVLALVEPSSISTQPLNLDSVRNEVSFVQNSVLASVDSSDFTLTHQYQAVPALAGTLLTDSG